MLGTFVALRVWLHLSPDADLDVAGYNIHHLFTGLALIAAGGIPLAVLRGGGRGLDLARLALGAGLGMALDEWVYLIATDGSNEAYLTPVSLLGGAAAVALAGLYTLALTWRRRPRLPRRDGGGPKQAPPAGRARSVRPRRASPSRRRD